jgi:single-stranded-DNA-specific exonuclease
MLLFLTLAGAATGYYYGRVTGSPFRTAYAVDRAAYGTVPFFLWQKPLPEPTYRHAVLREFYQGELAAYHYKRTPAGFYSNRGSWLWSSWGVYLGPLLTLPLLGFPWLFHDRKMRFVLLAGIIFLLAVMVETWLLPHYFAPATGLLWLLMVQGMRHLAQWRWLGKEIGRSLVRALPLIACAMVILRAGAVAAHVKVEPPWPRGNLQRATILRELESSPGQHLIVVRYSRQHDTNAEWVYNAAEIDAARAIGLDVVVVDHHQPPDTLPPAVAVINPHRRDCPFPDKGLCAAGLAFYLVIGLRARLREAGWFAQSGDPDIRGYLDIVTLGTIADMVPLTGVNRTLIRRGLSELGASTRPGVVALKQVCNMAAGMVSAGQVGFQLGPRINAAGRVDYGIKVVELLTTASSEIALRIAQELDEHNRQRRALEAAVLEQAVDCVEKQGKAAERYSVVVGAEGWHPGVLGIVAARLVEKYHRPTVVIGFDGERGKGSARSIRGFHMVEGFRRCADHLEKYGGHEYAGGLSISAEKLEFFNEAFEGVAREWLQPEDLFPCLEVDAELRLSDISLSLIRQLECLKPFGVGNPEPLFMTRRVEVCERKGFPAGARFRFRQDDRIIGGVAFGIAEDSPCAVGATIDISYRLAENEWNGTSTVDLKVIDARPAGKTDLQR